MESVVANESMMSYPPVAAGATQWVWSDKKPDDETIRVTVHGLRRLLRIAAKAYPYVATQCFSGKAKEIYAKEFTRDGAWALLNELSSVFCEGDLVMSRLFVTPDGKAVAHQDEEIDRDSMAPWEKDEQITRKGAVTE